MRLVANSAAYPSAQFAASWTEVHCRRHQLVAESWCPQRPFEIMLKPKRFPRKMTSAWDRVRWPQPEVTAHA